MPLRPHREGPRSPDAACRFPLFWGMRRCWRQIARQRQSGTGIRAQEVKPLARAQRQADRGKCCRLPIAGFSATVSPTQSTVVGVVADTASRRRRYHLSEHRCLRRHTACRRRICETAYSCPHRRSSRHWSDRCRTASRCQVPDYNLVFSKVRRSPRAGKLRLALSPQPIPRVLAHRAV